MIGINVITIKNENVVWIDVDETLVCYPNDPFKYAQGLLPFNQYGKQVYLRPHEKNINLLNSYFERGYFVIVHSANGHAWAREVVTKLMLSNKVNLIITKAATYVDDIQADSFMRRVYINE